VKCEEVPVMSEFFSSHFTKASCDEFLRAKYLYNMQTNGSGYAVYHSVHDNFYWMTHFGDPDFSHHRAMGLLWVEIALSLLTTPVFPGKAEDFGFIVSEIFETLQEKYGSILEENEVSLGI